jgi:hypothetical protein
MPIQILKYNRRISEEKRVNTTMKKITRKMTIIFRKNPPFYFCFRRFLFITCGVLILGYTEIFH